MSLNQVNNSALRTNKSSSSNAFNKNQIYNNPVFHSKSSYKLTRTSDKKQIIENPLQNRSNTFESEYQIKYLKDQGQLSQKNLHSKNRNFLTSQEGYSKSALKSSNQPKNCYLNVHQNRENNQNLNPENTQNCVLNNKINGVQKVNNFLSEVPQDSLQRTQESNKYATCKLKNVYLQNTITDYISLNDVYYKHMQGLCYCYICTCGKHLCDFAKLSHLQSPFKQTPAQSIYTVDYDPKKKLQNVKFDQKMYDDKRENPNHLDIESINHTDFKKPGLDSYGNSLSCKPVHAFDEQPQQLGRSQYKRDFLEWGTSYIPIKGSQQRTTIDALPFNGSTSYNKYFRGLKGPKAESAGNNYTITTSKSPIPFQALSTSQQFHSGLRPGDRAIIYKQKDELFTGMPAFQGQFKTLFQNDYINYNKNCPVIELRLRQEYHA